MRQILLSVAVAALAPPVFAKDKTLVNTDKTGVALQGYDPVVFLPTASQSKELQISRALITALIIAL